jgi:hypothetical protein
MIQVVGRYERSGSWVVRLLHAQPPAFFESDEMYSIAMIPEAYLVIITSLETAERDGTVTFLGNAPVPSAFENGVTLFRANAYVTGEGERRSPEAWWLTDGLKSWKVGRLEEQYRRLPHTTHFPISALKDLIKSGWHPNDEFEATSDSQQKLATSVSADIGSTDRNVSFYLLFDSEEDAIRAKASVENQFPGILTELSDSDTCDGAVLRIAAPPDFIGGIDGLDRIELALTAIAERHSGSFDGNDWPM